MDAMMALGKAYIKSLSAKDDFDKLLSKIMLQETEYTVLKEVYLEQQSLGYVADLLGYSLQNVKIIHKRALLKVASYVHRCVDLS